MDKKLFLTLIIFVLISSLTIAEEPPRSVSHSPLEIMPGGLNEPFMSFLEPGDWVSPGAFEFLNTTIYINSLVTSIIDEIPFDTSVSILQHLKVNNTIGEDYHLDVGDGSFKIYKTVITSLLPFNIYNSARIHDYVRVGSSCDGASPSMRREGLSYVFDLGTDGACVDGDPCVHDLDCFSSNCEFGSCTE